MTAYGCHLSLRYAALLYVTMSIVNSRYYAIGYEHNVDMLRRRNVKRTHIFYRAHSFVIARCEGVEVLDACLYSEIYAYFYASRITISEPIEGGIGACVRLKERKQIINERFRRMR